MALVILHYLSKVLHLLLEPPPSTLPFFMCGQSMQVTKIVQMYFSVAWIKPENILFTVLAWILKHLISLITKAFSNQYPKSSAN